VLCEEEGVVAFRSAATIRADDRARNPAGRIGWRRIGPVPESPPATP